MQRLDEQVRTKLSEKVKRLPAFILADSHHGDKNRHQHDHQSQGQSAEYIENIEVDHCAQIYGIGEDSAKAGTRVGCQLLKPFLSRLAAQYIMENTSQLSTGINQNRDHIGDDSQQECYQEQVFNLLDGAGTSNWIHGRHGFFANIEDDGVEQHDNSCNLCHKEECPNYRLPTGREHATHIGGGSTNAAVENQFIEVPKAEGVGNPVYDAGNTFGKCLFDNTGCAVVNIRCCHAQFIVCDIVCKCLYSKSSPVDVVIVGPNQSVASRLTKTRLIHSITFQHPVLESASLCLAANRSFNRNVIISTSIAVEILIHRIFWLLGGYH